MEPVRDWEALPRGSRVLCALSGGADSVCLLHWLARQEDLTVYAAHFNHRLRGEEADGDEAFVRELCQRWDIPLTVGRGDVKALARAEKRSVEEAGRVLRYEFLQETAQAEGCELIATAHNADDNAETMLLSLLRGTGLTGLTGIPPRRGNIVRPLLGTTRQEIFSYLDRYDLPHREDSSNSDETYARNKLRAQVMPVLRQLNGRAVEHMANTAAQLTEIDRYLDETARGLLASTKEGPGRVSLPMKVLSQAPPALRPRMIFQLLDRLGVGRRDIRSVHLEAVLSLPSGGSLDLPQGVTARREYDTLVLTTRTDAGPLWTAFSPVEGLNPVPGPGWGAVLEGPPWPGLAVRPRQTGDAVKLPNGHTRSLKKLFIDRKVPRADRDAIPIAADDDGVIAVAGLVENSAHPKTGRITFIKIAEKEENGQ